MKKEIDVFEYAGEIFKALPKGVLVTTEAEDCVNAMTLGWATLGIEWDVPIFTANIRVGRFTHELIERTGEFAVCVPCGATDEKIVTKARGICGSRSGRDADKIAQAGLTLVDCDLIQPPAIKEFPLTLECRVVFSQVQSYKEISSKFKNFYPDVDDPHVAYCGEILKAYIIE